MKKWLILVSKLRGGVRSDDAGGGRSGDRTGGTGGRAKAVNVRPLTRSRVRAAYVLVQAGATHAFPFFLRPWTLASEDFRKAGAK